jgi:hypothetical protein
MWQSPAPIAYETASSPSPAADTSPAVETIGFAAPEQPTSPAPATSASPGTGGVVATPGDPAAANETAYYVVFCTGSGKPSALSQITTTSPLPAAGFCGTEATGSPAPTSIGLTLVLPPPPSSRWQAPPKVLALPGQNTSGTSNAIRVITRDYNGTTVNLN